MRDHAPTTPVGVQMARDGIELMTQEQCIALAMEIVLKVTSPRCTQHLLRLSRQAADVVSAIERNESVRLFNLLPWQSKPTQSARRSARESVARDAASPMAPVSIPDHDRQAGTDEDVQECGEPVATEAREFVARALTGSEPMTYRFRAGPPEGGAA